MRDSVQFRITSFSDIPKAVQDTLQESGKETTEKDGVVYYRTGNYVFSCESSAEADLLFTSLQNPDVQACNISGRDKILYDSLMGNCNSDILRRVGIMEKSDRCVILFRTRRGFDTDSANRLIPLEDDDYLVVLDDYNIAVIMHMNKRSMEDIVEFAGAVSETMENEGGISCQAGIGNIVSSFSLLSSSFREAGEALDAAKRHNLHGPVFVYRKQTLERLADLIPAEKSRELINDIIPSDIQKQLTSELMDTVKSLFENDLNFSVTARKMYIHRNTLLYRLDKIKKTTGLDLRKFEDAAVFRFLMSLSDNTQ